MSSSATNINIISLTANCGLSGIETEEFDKIGQKADSAPPKSVIVLAAQECHLKDTMDSFEHSDLANKYHLASVKNMPTFTKLKGGTGLITLVLTPKHFEYTVDVKESIIRRGFFGFNKGGIYSSMHFISADKVKFKVNHINYHLDSNDEKARSWDIFNIYQHEFCNFSNFDSLAKNTPHCFISAGDSNIRNQYDKDDENKDINVWSYDNTSEANDAIIDYLMMVSGLAYSGNNTYHKGKVDNRIIHHTGKRKGYINQGALDRINICTNDEFSEAKSVNKINTAPIDISVNTQSNSKRDHDIIGGCGSFNPVIDDFTRVQAHLYHRLIRIAPLLAKGIKDLKANDESKNQLLKIHQFFYGNPNGLIRQLINPNGIANSALKKTMLTQMQSLTLENYHQNNTINTFLAAATRHNRAYQTSTIANAILLAATTFSVISFSIGFTLATFGLGGLVVAASVGMILKGASLYQMHIEKMSGEKLQSSITSYDSTGQISKGLKAKILDGEKMSNQYSPKSDLKPRECEKSTAKGNGDIFEKSPQRNEIDNRDDNGFNP